MYDKYTEKTQYNKYYKSIDAENNKIEHICIRAKYMIFLLFGK